MVCMRHLALAGSTDAPWIKRDIGAHEATKPNQTNFFFSIFARVHTPHSIRHSCLMNARTGINKSSRGLGLEQGAAGHPPDPQ